MCSCPWSFWGKNAATVEKDRKMFVAGCPRGYSPGPSSVPGNPPHSVSWLLSIVIDFPLVVSTCISFRQGIQGAAAHSEKRRTSLKEASSSWLLFTNLWSLNRAGSELEPFSHSPRVPACKHPAILASSLFPPSQTGHTHTPHLRFPHLSALPGSWKCPDRFHAHSPSLLGSLGVHPESLA